MLETRARLKHAVKGAARAAATLDGVTPHEVVWRSGPARLRYYAPAEGTTPATPLVFVLPIINRYRVVDLHEGGSMVASLRARGIPVYLVDWGAPRRIDAGTDFADYATRHLPAISRVVGEREGARQVDVLGYCLGGTISVMFAACFPGRVRRLATMMAPVDFHTGEAHVDLLQRWIEPEHFPVERLTGAFGNMPGSLVQQGFLWQRPTVSLLKYYNSWQRFTDAEFAAFFTALEWWSNDGTDIPGAAYRTLIRDLYRHNRLAQGTLTLRGRPVDPGRITCPVLVITASYDTTCPPGAATALLDLVASRQKEQLALRGGHVTPVVGRKSRERLHDPLADWLLA